MTQGSPANVNPMNTTTQPFPTTPTIPINNPIDLAPPIPPDLLPVVIGDSGTQRYGGYFREEFNRAWLDENRVDTVEEMRRTDATVEEGLIALKAPILAAEWDVECGSDDPKDQEIEEWVEQNIFGMKRTWKDFLREALTYFDFGFCVFEKVYERREDGRMWLSDLEPRIQRSVQRWQLQNKTRGIVQYIRTDEANKWIAEIPIQKLFVLTNNKEGDDLTGRSVLRPAYKHYYSKDVLYRIAGIAAERYGVGIPVVTMPEGVAGEADKAKAYEMGRQIRSNENAAIVLPNDKWKIEILTPKAGAMATDIKALIDHHDRMILSSMLAAFLNLGSTDTGSFALSKDQHGFLLTHVQDKASYFAEQFTQQVIKPLVELNFGKVKNLPKLVFTKLGENDLKLMSDWLVALANAQLVKVDAKLKEWIHTNFGLPPLTEEDIAQMETDDVDSELGSMDAPADDAQAIPADDGAAADDGDSSDLPADDEEQEP